MLTLLWQKIKLLTGDKALKKTQIDSILKKLLMAKNGRNERRSEGQSLSSPIMPPKLRKMVFLHSGHRLLRIFLNKFRQKMPTGWLGRAQFSTVIMLLITVLP